MLRQFLGRFGYATTSQMVPRPTESVQDVATFLGRIKRGCESYGPKFPTWESLFQADGRSLEKQGIPVRARRWILLWAEKFRQGTEPYYIKPSQKGKRPKKTTRKAFKHLDK